MLPPQRIQLDGIVQVFEIVRRDLVQVVLQLPDLLGVSIDREGPSLCRSAVPMGCDVSATPISTSRVLRGSLLVYRYKEGLQLSHHTGSHNFWRSTSIHMPCDMVHQKTYAIGCTDSPAHWGLYRLFWVDRRLARCGRWLVLVAPGRHYRFRTLFNVLLLTPPPHLLARFGMMICSVTAKRWKTTVTSATMARSLFVSTARSDCTTSRCT